MAKQLTETSTLTTDQQDEADRIYQQIRAAFDGEARRLAQLMAAKPTAKLFGETEFEVRDRLHELGQRLLEAAADVRVKKGRLSRC